MQRMSPTVPPQSADPLESSRQSSENKENFKQMENAADNPLFVEKSSTPIEVPPKPMVEKKEVVEEVVKLPPPQKAEKVEKTPVAEADPSQ